MHSKDAPTSRGVTRGRWSLQTKTGIAISEDTVVTTVRATRLNATETLGCGTPRHDKCRVGWTGVFVGVSRRVCRVVVVRCTDGTRVLRTCCSFKFVLFLSVCVSNLIFYTRKKKKKFFSIKFSEFFIREV